jgi:UDP-N-acetylglucosamine--N-acetylmuramyl-(pentapeptide) pyrophosphoryl-undecaprenol N-acetylglucosamine transferase
VIIAGGGTGGHIYPGIAIARAFEKRHPGWRVHFVGARGGLEEKIVPREGFQLHVVPIGKLHQSVGRFARLRTILTLPYSFFITLKLFIQLRPRAVLGVGGFASGPMLFVAALLRCRTLIWEPNAYPGLANRWLARWVDECLLVFKEAGSFLQSANIVTVGLPVRTGMVPMKRDQSHRSLRVLIFGGSQGAHFINKLALAAFRDEGGWLEGVEVVHQTGARDFSEIAAAYAQEGAGNFRAFEYLHDMTERYRWADVVICRSGASSVAEISACQKAAVFIPLPTAADDHQRKNAEALSRQGAAVTMLQNELTPAKFRATIAEFRDRPEILDRMEQNITRFQFKDAAETIAARLLSAPNLVSK